MEGLCSTNTDPLVTSYLTELHDLCYTEGIMISDLEFNDKTDNPHWRFSVTAYVGKYALRTVGWRFWPKSQDIKPPMFKIGKQFQPIVRFETPGAWQRIKDDVQEAIASMNPSDGPLFQLFKYMQNAGHESSMVFKTQYPDLFRAYYIANLDPTMQGLFDSLPEGRLWPDEYCKVIAQNLLDGEWTVDDVAWHVTVGIYTPADYKRITELFAK